MIPPSSALLCLLAGAPLASQEAPTAPAPAQAPAPDPAPADRTSVTSHTVAIGGVDVPYEATAGTLVLRTEEGAAKAELFYVAYVRSGVEDKAARPIMFCFNGGPGSSSVWLHLGVFGPRRVRKSITPAPAVPSCVGCTPGWKNAAPIASGLMAENAPLACSGLNRGMPSKYTAV